MRCRQQEANLKLCFQLESLQFPDFAMFPLFLPIWSNAWGVLFFFFSSCVVYLEGVEYFQPVLIKLDCTFAKINRWFYQYFQIPKELNFLNLILISKYFSFKANFLTVCIMLRSQLSQLKLLRTAGKLLVRHWHPSLAELSPWVANLLLNEMCEWLNFDWWFWKSVLFSILMAVPAFF